MEAVGGSKCTLCPLPCCFPEIIHFHPPLLMFIGFLGSNLGVALLLLMLLLTCGMMV